MEGSIPSTDARSMLPWPSWVEVDLDALCHNVRAVRQTVGPNCTVMAVVKAQGYGHGAEAAARAALEGGAAWLGVARVREGVLLREAGIEAPILVLGPMAPAEVGTVVELGLRPTVVSPEQAAALSMVARRVGTTVAVHVKVETGLGRYGIPVEELLSWLPAASRLPGLVWEGLYSHFASADEEDLSYSVAQLESFRAARERLRVAGFDFQVCHMAASAAFHGLSASHMDMVRIGLSLYGLYPSSHVRRGAILRPALSVHSRIARVFALEAGRSVGYGRSFVAERPMRVALVPMGYADGLPRSHSNNGFVLVNGRRAPIVGRVSMDQCVVDVSDCGQVAVGDPVVVIGSQGGESIDCDEFAARSGTISYEVLTSIGLRLPRVYMRDGRVVSVAFLDEGRMVPWQP